MIRYPRFRRLSRALVCAVRLSGTGIVATASSASVAVAQRGVTNAGVDLGLGVSFGHSGTPYGLRDGVGLSVVASARLRRLSRGALVAGVNGHTSSPMGLTADCAPSPDGGCAPTFPTVSALGLLVGWELRQGERGATLRASAGPALVLPSDLGTTGGVQGRLDVSTPSVGHLAIIGYAHHLVGAGSADLGVSSFGVGVRIR